MRLTVELRCLIGQATDRGVNKSLVARVLGVTRKTVYKWDKRRKHLKDRKRKAKKNKVTLEVEFSILALRNSLGWGTARIQQSLFAAPPFVKEAIPGLVQKVKLSRTAINNVLKKHNLNGYKKKSEGWKFFRAKKPNELWQLDLKGPFTLQGIKYWFVICIDDHSRYLLLNEWLDHYPTTEEIFFLLRPLIEKHRPKKILTDNGSQFKEMWKELCKEYKVEPLFAHPYYPQDKGKVERAIRNVAEEFIYLLKKFPEWLSRIGEYTVWFNEERFHRGIQCIPAELFT